MKAELLREAVTFELEPVKWELGVTRIVALNDKVKVEIGGTREVWVEDITGNARYQQNGGRDQYLIVVWDHRHGDNWACTATSYSALGHHIGMAEMAEAFAATIRQADNRPLSASEAAALIGTPWYIRLVNSLARRSRD